MPSAWATAAELDREGVVRVAATAERRLGGRTVKRLAVWLSPLADAIDGGAAAAAELVARGVVEGSFDPRTIYREGVDGSRRSSTSSSSSRPVATPRP